MAPKANFQVIRHFANGNGSETTILTGLTLKQAKEHCNP